MAGPYPPIFIVGTGRCGSTMMSNLIRMHPKILSLSEVFVSFATEGFVHSSLDGERFWRLITEASPVLRRTINPVRSPVEFTYPFPEGGAWTMETLPACLYMTLPHLSETPDALYQEMESFVRSRPDALLADQYRFWFDWLTERQEKSVWMERSGNSITMVKALHRLFPDAKFVHIHRDGRETAMSIQNFMPLRFFFHTWVRLKKIGIDLLKDPFRYSDSQILSFFAPIISGLLPVERYLDKEPDIVEVGKFWSAMIMQGLDDLEAVPKENIHTMSYVDLVSDPEPALRSFVEFTAPDLIDEDWIQKATKIPRKTPPKWKDLPQDTIDRLNIACGPAMERLGYKF